MRLQFELKSVKISPVCHIQLARHADQFKDKYATGQCYGALYDDEAHITNIMAFPEADMMSTKEQLDQMEKRHEECVNTFNLDNQSLGWYMVCYKQNFWDGLEAVKYYEKYINTSFFLVYDYTARNKGINPYKAFRLSHEFALKEDFTMAKISDINLQQHNPLEQIPAFVEKHELFQAMMLLNKNKFIEQFGKKHKQGKKKNEMGKKFDEYIQSLQQHQDMLKVLGQKKAKDNQPQNIGQYCQFMGLMLKAEQQETSLKKYHKNIKTIQKALCDQQ